MTEKGRTRHRRSNPTWEERRFDCFGLAPLLAAFSSQQPEDLQVPGVEAPRRPWVACTTGWRL